MVICFMDLSIIIVSYNTADLIASCLNSILTTNIGKEIFVVDNASNDGIAKVVRDGFPSEIGRASCRERV